MILNFDIVQDITGLHEQDIRKPARPREGRATAVRAMVARYLYDCGWASTEIAQYLGLSKNANKLIQAHETFIVSRRGYAITFNALCTRMALHLSTPREDTKTTP